VAGATLLLLTGLFWKFRILDRGTNPTIEIGPVDLEEGAQILAGAVVQASARIGQDAIVNSGALVDHDCQIGTGAHLAPGSTLSGGVIVGKFTHVGCGATIIQGIRVGEGCLVAAGAVVVRDVPDHSLAMGVPARFSQLRSSKGV
jgi:UDP-perosamine 4-acetyltransferase